MTKPEADKMYEFVIKYPRQAAFKLMELEAEVKDNTKWLRLAQELEREVEQLRGEMEHGK